MSPLRRHLLELLAVIERHELSLRAAVSRANRGGHPAVRALVLRQDAAGRRRLAHLDQIAAMLGDRLPAEAMETGVMLLHVRPEAIGPEGDYKPEHEPDLMTLAALEAELTALACRYRSLGRVLDALAMGPLSRLLAQPLADLDRLIAAMAACHQRLILDRLAPGSTAPPPSPGMERVSRPIAKPSPSQAEPDSAQTQRFLAPVG